MSAQVPENSGNTYYSQNTAPPMGTPAHHCNCCHCGKAASTLPAVTNINIAFYGHPMPSRDEPSAQYNPYSQPQPQPQQQQPQTAYNSTPNPGQSFNFTAAPSPVTTSSSSSPITPVGTPQQTGAPLANPQPRQAHQGPVNGGNLAAALDTLSQNYMGVALMNSLYGEQGGRNVVSEPHITSSGRRPIRGPSLQARTFQQSNIPIQPQPPVPPLPPLPPLLPVTPINPNSLNPFSAFLSSINAAQQQTGDSSVSFQMSDFSVPTAASLAEPSYPYANGASAILMGTVPGAGGRMVIHENGQLGFLADPASLSAMFVDADYFECAGVPETLSPEQFQCLCQRTLTDDDMTVECTICKEDLGSGEILCTLPCGHEYCHECIAHWFHNYGTTCPLCRMDARQSLNVPSLQTAPETAQNMSFDEGEECDSDEEESGSDEDEWYQ